MSFLTTARRPLAALALSAGVGLTGCAAIPGVTFPGVPSVSPPTAPTTSPENADPSSEPTPTPTGTRTTTSPRPTSTPTSSPTSDARLDDDEVRNGYVPKASVEVKVQAMIQEKTGKTSYVQCPGNLTARVGESMVCDLKRLEGTATNGRFEVKVTAIEGRRVNYNVRSLG